MSQVTRLRIDELVMEFILHSNRKHIYVEGSRDKAFYEWHIKKAGMKDVSIFEINDIDVPNDLIATELRNNGNKGRLIALAKQLEKELSDRDSKILCIVDADYDWVLDRCLENKFLAYTDGTSVEMFAFSERPIQRVLSLALGAADLDADTILKAIRQVLRDMFLIRSTNEKLQLNLSWIACANKKRLHSKGDGSLAIDITEYIKDYLNKGNLSNNLNRFTKTLGELRDKTTDFNDIMIIRGHDFVKVLHSYLKCKLPSRRTNNITAEALQAMLLMSIEGRDLFITDLFKSITDVFNESA